MRKRVQVKFNTPSRTKQCFKEECDMNNIIKRFKKTVGTDFLDRYQGYVGGQFGDFTDVSDYRSAIDQINRADEVFMALPAVLRAKFDNDAASFLDFCQNPNNRDELRAMGLLNPEVPPKSTPNEVLEKDAEKVPVS